MVCFTQFLLLHQQAVIVPEIFGAGKSQKVWNLQSRQPPLSETSDLKIFLNTKRTYFSKACGPSQMNSDSQPVKCLE